MVGSLIEDNFQFGSVRFLLFVDRFPLLLDRCMVHSLRIESPWDTHAKTTPSRGALVTVAFAGYEKSLKPRPHERVLKVCFFSSVGWKRSFRSWGWFAQRKGQLVTAWQWRKASREGDWKEATPEATENGTNVLQPQMIVFVSFYKSIQETR